MEIPHLLSAPLSMLQVHRQPQELKNIIQFNQFSCHLIENFADRRRVDRLDVLSWPLGATEKLAFLVRFPSRSVRSRVGGFLSLSEGSLERARVEEEVDERCEVVDLREACRQSRTAVQHLGEVRLHLLRYQLLHGLICSRVDLVLSKKKVVGGQWEELKGEVVRGAHDSGERWRL